MARVGHAAIHFNDEQLCGLQEWWGARALPAAVGPMDVAEDSQLGPVFSESESALATAEHKVRVVRVVVCAPDQV